jgi:hypothetical protein
MDMTLPAPMPESSQFTPPHRRRDSWTIVGLILCITAVAFVLEYRWRPAVFHEGRVFFADPDDYLRLYRVRELLEGRGPVIRRLPEMNWPVGGELHWTAPMDYVLAGWTLAIGPLVGGMDAAAAWLPVILGLASLLIMMTGLARACGWPLALFAGLTMIIMRPFHRPFALGHPDHHCLLEMLIIIATTTWLARPDSRGAPVIPSRRAAVVSGLATGLALWVAPQAMAVWIAILAGLVAGGYIGDSGQRSAWDARRIIWCRVVWLVVATAYFIENYHRLGAIEADRISLFHFTLVTLSLFIPSGVQAGVAANPRRISQRWIPLLLASAAFVIWMGLRHDTIFRFMKAPEFFRWSGYIVELQPLWTIVNGQWSLAQMHDKLGWMPYLLPFTLWFFLRSSLLAPPTRIIFGLLALGFTALSILQRRWLDHVSLGLISVTVVGLYEIAGRVVAAHRPLRMRFLITIVAVLALYIPCVDFLLKPPSKTPTALDLRTAFVADRIMEYERRHPAAKNQPRAIMSNDVSFLLYRTRLPVVSVAYHRTLEGLMESARFYAERDPAAALEQLRRLGVRYVVVPYRPHEVLMSLEYIAYGELRSYDAPVASMDAEGLLQQELRYKPEIAETMIYRLAMNSDHPPAGLECIAVIKEGAGTPSGYSGLIYVVSETSATSSARTDSLLLIGSLSGKLAGWCLVERPTPRCVTL